MKKRGPKKSPISIPIVGLRWNRYGKASPTQNAVIELRISHNGKTKYLSTRLRVLPKEWDERNKMIVNRFDAIQLNQHLDRLITDVRKICYEMYEKGRVDIDSIPARLIAKQKPVKNFVDFCEERAKVRKYGKTRDSQERYDRFLRFLNDYGKIRTFSDLTDARLMEMDSYLQKKKMLAKSRWNNYHRFLNSFILDAKKEGLMAVNPYDQVKIEKGTDYDGLGKHLTPEEFLLIREVELPSRLEKVRDLFVFQTFTCLSYRDLKVFDVKRIQDLSGQKLYTSQRGKTKIDFLIPLLEPALEILTKYSNQLPMVSNVKYNEYLKEVAAAAGIGKPITTHWARHTGATLLLNAGVPMEVVSKVCGHSSIKMTERIYAKLLPRTVVAEVNKAKNKLIN